MKIKKSGNVKPAVQLIMAITLIALGIVMLVAPRTFMNGLFIVVSVTMVVFGIMCWIECIFGSKKRTRIASLFVGILYIVLGVLILVMHRFFSAAFTRVFGALAAVQGIASLISGFLLFKDSVSGYIRKFIIAVFELVLAFMFFINPLDNIRVLEIISAIYVILVGISSLIDFVDSFLSTDYANKKVKPKIAIAPPIAFAAFIPSRVLKFINKKLESGEVKDSVFSKPTETYGTLEVFIHLQEGLIEGMGHCDICLENTVYSYGCYNPHTLKLGGFIAGGTMAMADRTSYIKHCLKFEKKKLVGFSIDLNKTEYLNVKAEIGKMLSVTAPWKCDLQNAIEGKKSEKECSEIHDPASELYRAAGSQYAEFKSGKYKTYFALGSNCVMFAFDILQNAGLDRLSFSGAITPGTYFSHLENLYHKKNSFVTGMRIYGETNKKSLSN